MLFFRRYRLFWTLVAVMAVIGSSFWWTNVPRAYVAEEKAPVSFSLGYFSGEHKPGDVRAWMKRAEGVAFFAASDALWDKNVLEPVSSFYPVYDGSTDLATFTEAYSYLPSDAVPGRGRSVYTFDYGKARFLYLAQGDEAETAWMERVVRENKQPHNVVLAAQLPHDNKLWQKMREIGITLVLSGGAVYTPEQAVTQSSADFQPSRHLEWGVWKTVEQFDHPHLLVLEGRDSVLRVTAEDEQGEPLDLLETDLSILVQEDGSDERAVVAIQSTWRYMPGSAEIPQTVPENFDLTGEHPITEPFHLPKEDWRAADFDDSAWELGRAPFGHAKEPEYPGTFATELPRNDTSPTTYFRKTFELDDDPAAIEELYVQAAYEDGLVIYLNGEEIARDGIRTGLVDHASLAEPNSFTFYKRIKLKNHRDKLLPGKNTLAVEVHKSHPKAPRLFFDLGLSYKK